jgi:hypothetical protein
MSLIKRNPRRASLGAVILVLALAGGGAFAYFTTSGSGTGEATVSNPSNSLEVTGTPVAALAPGIGKTSTITIKNTSEGTVHLGTLQVSITGNSQSATGCKTSWFKVSPETSTFGPTGVELAAAGTKTAVVEVSMVNVEESQNACKGATVNLHYAAE